MLCLTLSEKTIDEDIDTLWKNRQYVDLAELRIDYLDLSDTSVLQKISQFPSLVDLPVILTCRRVCDGGKFEGTDRKKISIMRKIIEGDFAYIDIENDISKPEFEAYIRSRGIRIIKSIHDLKGIPDNLYSAISKISEKGDIPKVAVTPNSIQDVLKMFRIESELTSVKEKIIVGMGDYGTCTRILYKRLGSLLTFCSDNSLNGMLTPVAMRELYHSDRVNAQTRIYGVIGSPIKHTVSPNIHNTGFHGIRFNAIYVPFLVDSVRDFFKLAELLKINGFSITIPHKQNVIPFLGKTSREVREVGSCNTIVREHGLWKGSNTDYYGFLSLIEQDLEAGRIKNALVIGAGGGARALVWALRNHNVNVTILNRTLDRASRLAKETMSSFDSLENASEYSGKADIIVQATSVGMEPDYDKDPVPSLSFTGKEIVCDLIYKPHKTKFLRRADQAGCKIIYGLDCLLAQGKLQFEAYTGYHYPPNANPQF